MKEVLSKHFTVACLTLITIVDFITGGGSSIFLWFFYGVYKLLSYDD